MKWQDNVTNFIHECSEDVGNHSKFGFLADIMISCDTQKIESPIEQILYCALHFIAKINYWDEAICVLPQYQIEKYRVDFSVAHKNPKNEITRVIIECDSQEFHDRTEPERRYEKMRDRFLQKMGYKIFRFTGSEISQKPIEVAVEIISYLTGIDENSIVRSCKASE